MISTMPDSAAPMFTAELWAGFPILATIEDRPTILRGDDTKNKAKNAENHTQNVMGVNFALQKDFGKYASKNYQPSSQNLVSKRYNNFFSNIEGEISKNEVI